MQHRAPLECSQVEGIPCKQEMQTDNPSYLGEDGKVEVNNRHVENLVRKTEKRHFVGKWNSKMFAVCSVYASK